MDDEFARFALATTLAEAEEEVQSAPEKRDEKRAEICRIEAQLRATDLNAEGGDDERDRLDRGRHDCYTQLSALESDLVRASSAAESMSSLMEE
jgi:hypothetical protein